MVRRMVTLISSKLLNDVALHTVGKQGEARRKRNESKNRDNRASRPATG